MLLSPALDIEASPRAIETQYAILKRYNRMCKVIASEMLSNLRLTFPVMREQSLFENVDFISRTRTACIKNKKTLLSKEKKKKKRRKATSSKTRQTGYSFLHQTQSLETTKKNRNTHHVLQTPSLSPSIPSPSHHSDNPPIKHE